MITSSRPRPKVVTGEKVFLSHVFAEDASLLAQWFADLEFTTLLGQQGRSFTLEQEQQWITESTAAKDSERSFAIVLCANEQLIGTCNLRSIDLLHGTAELGIAIGDKTAWGRGTVVKLFAYSSRMGFATSTCTASGYGCMVSTNVPVALTWQPAFARQAGCAGQRCLAASATTVFSWKSPATMFAEVRHVERANPLIDGIPGQFAPDPRSSGSTEGAGKCSITQ